MPIPLLPCKYLRLGFFRLSTLKRARARSRLFPIFSATVRKHSLNDERYMCFVCLRSIYSRRSHSSPFSPASHPFTLFLYSHPRHAPCIMTTMMIRMLAQHCHDRVSVLLELRFPLLTHSQCSWRCLHCTRSILCVCAWRCCCSSGWLLLLLMA